MEATLTPLGGILISFIPFLNVPSCNLPIGCVFITKFPSYALSDNLETSSNFSIILKLLTIHRILLLLPSSIFKTEPIFIDSSLFSSFHFLKSTISIWTKLGSKLLTLN